MLNLIWNTACINTKLRYATFEEALVYQACLDTMAAFKDTVILTHSAGSQEALWIFQCS